MSHNSCKSGYIYIYKCVLNSSLCKIGVTGNLKSRFLCHKNNLYHGFGPYTNFLTGAPIFSAISVKNKDEADCLVRTHFKGCQLGGIEIYNIKYNEAIKELYVLLNKHNQFIELIEDGVTDYSFLQYDEKISFDTSKSSFEKIKQEILSKYDDLPTELLKLLRTKADIQDNCPSHLMYGNYVEFPGDMILDLNFDKTGRVKILTQLNGFIDN